jgi:hypothetical protein
VKSKKTPLEKKWVKDNSTKKIMVQNSQKSAPQKYELRKRRYSSGKFFITINCDTKDSVIYLNNKKVGVGSFTLKKLDPGYYRLKAKHYGEKLFTTFFLRNGSGVRVDISFKRNNIIVKTK